jgi:uncharacterized membrane protein (UPF0127 family)
MIVFRALAALLLLLPAACQAGNPDVTKAASGLSVVPLDIRTASGKTYSFKVEVARSESEQARGLMFRDALAPDGGMIFPMSPPRPASFWMKNTVISLDLIFIRPDGVIARIAAEAVPYSLEPIDSGEPVSAVLEIAGGRAAELGISEGDKVRWTR